MKALEWSQDFPHFNTIKLSQAFWSYLAQNLMQPFHHLNDVLD